MYERGFFASVTVQGCYAGNPCLVRNSTSIMSTDKKSIIDDEYSSAYSG